MKVFVDTNVLIDYVCSRQPFYNAARRLFAYAKIDEIEMLFSDISVINTLYIGVNQGYSSSFLTEVLRNVLTFAHISVMNETVVNDALSSSWIDKEDAVQHYSAVASMAECVVTRNKQDFLLSAMPVYTPDELLDILKNKPAS